MNLSLCDPPRFKISPKLEQHSLENATKAAAGMTPSQRDLRRSCYQKIETLSKQIDELKHRLTAGRVDVHVIECRIGLATS